MVNRLLLKNTLKEKTGRGDLINLLSEACNVSKPTANNWLTNKTKMPIDAVADTQKAFELTDAEIIKIFVRG